MRESDVIVIGAGLAGLIAAAAAAKQGKKVLLLTKGAGTLTIGGGIIDVLGYLDDGKPVLNPVDGMACLTPDHPYGKIGIETVVDSINFLLKICENEGYPQIGSCRQMQWVPTAAGMLKPTCIVPKTMDVSGLKKTTNRVVVGFKYLKDFYPQLVAKNLATMPGFEGNYKVAMVSPPFECGRDIGTLDIARWLDTEEGLKECTRQLQQVVKAGSTLIIPPVLGTNPDYLALGWLEKNLECHLLETVTVPPSITGLRLRTMLLNYVKKQGVRIIEQAFVTESVIDKGRCAAVVTEAIDRQRFYYAKSFIVATGGIFGGGIIVEPDQVREPIFRLPVKAPLRREDWANQALLSNAKQPFAQIGITVDEKMQPLDVNGNVVLPNVYIAGRTLAGYDAFFEKSGNGVAVSSGYKAAMSV
ncbi:Anaerobic glycerol-3-phosphate dehydrogenase subunit B [bioreactor metagenome]|uniref:Anaerobic glycerol-3-phosphate dehydrogenase subunit B n=1 Tax=bioreactor metagenome TaxID=1076179 RepID=A0A644TQ51_9ZZZZ|nr:anaerobic glycerol-3-phosphate dehydrogenase subunit GlpB [Negativicutes bacterium]